MHDAGNTGPQIQQGVKIGHDLIFLNIIGAKLYIYIFFHKENN